MRHIDIRFEFDVDEEILEEDGEEIFNLVGITRLDTDIPDDDRYGIAEILAQSDRYWTEHCWKIIDLIGEKGSDEA